LSTAGCRQAPGCLADNDSVDKHSEWSGHGTYGTCIVCTSVRSRDVSLRNDNDVPDLEYSLLNHSRVWVRVCFWEQISPEVSPCNQVRKSNSCASKSMWVHLARLLKAILPCCRWPQAKVRVRRPSSPCIRDGPNGASSIQICCDDS
jgi:hypothetical protein